MSADHNAALVRQYFEECVTGASGPDQQRALAIVDDLLTGDFVMFFNNETEAEAQHGRDSHKEFLVDHARDYPDDHWTVEALIADEESAACQWRIHAKHAKTGNPIDVRAADFYRFRDGRLAELRRFLDFKSFDRQKRPRPARA
jgi:ketosteroid isomerase-like protein